MTSSRLKLIVIAATALFGALIFTTEAYAELSGLEREGKKIFQEGSPNPEQPVTARIATDGIELPAATFPCINCHDPEGNDRSEGVLTYPGLAWNTLTNANIYRKSYVETTLKKAISEGYSPSGKQLASTMPRYNMTAEQLDSLIAYLKKIGTVDDTAPGVDTDSINLGIRLPLTGKFAPTGELILNTLKACLANINAGGGIYGRKLEMVVEQIPQDSSNFTNHSNTKPIFAYVSNFYEESALLTNEKQPKMSSIAPISLMASQHKNATDNLFYLLPDLAIQAKTVANYTATYKSNPKQKFVIIHGTTNSDKEIAIAAYQQAKINKTPVQRQEIANFNLSSLTKFFDKFPANGNNTNVLFIGDPVQFLSLTQVIGKNKHPPTIYVLLAKSGQNLFKMPKTVAPYVRIVSPFNIDDVEGLKQLSVRLAEQQVRLTNPGLQAAACAEVDVFSEAAKQTGKKITRSKIIEALQKMDNFYAPFLPRISFLRGKDSGIKNLLILDVNLENTEFRVLDKLEISLDLTN